MKQRSKQSRMISAATVIAAALAVLPLASSPARAESGPGYDDPNNWPQYHRSYNAWRFSPLSQINKSNVKKLKVAWIHQPGNITHGLQATPIVIDGVMYTCLLYTSPSPRDRTRSRMPSSA